MDESAVWYSPDGSKISTAELLGWIRATRGFDPYKEFDLIVGSDSQAHGKTVRFVTVVCLYRHGKGGNYYYTFEHLPRTKYKGQQHKRIFEEVERSINAASFLNEILGYSPIVHVDASPRKAQWFTSSFSDQLKGYVSAYGFMVTLKPEAWVANCVANKHSR